MRRYWFGVALGALALGAGIGLTATAAWLIATASYAPPVLTLLVAVVAVRAFGLARPVLRYLERLTTHDAALRIAGSDRARIYQTLIPLAPARLRHLRHGELLTQLVADAESGQDKLLRVRAPVVTAVIVGVFSVALLGWLYLPVGVLLGVFLLVGGLGSWWLASRGLRHISRSRAHHQAQLADEIVTTLRGCGELTINGTLDSEFDRIADTNAALAATQQRAAWATGLGSALAIVAGGLAVVGVALLAAPAVTTGELATVTFAVLVMAPLAMFEGNFAIPNAAVSAAQVRSGERRLAALFHQPAAVTEPATPRQLNGAYDISLRNLSASWSPGVPVLKNLTIDIPAGQRVAVVGPSGVGKSTLAAVLLRFLNPPAGKYRLGGIDATTIPGTELRRVVGLIDSQAHLFASTLRENLKLARPVASDAELCAALKAARLPMPLDTWLGEGGAAISGGERQRVGIARALLADFDVLILDEPTAHLDARTAHEVLADLFEAATGKTIVLITHQLAHLTMVDEVIQLDFAPNDAGRMALCGNVRLPK